MKVFLLLLTIFWIFKVGSACFPTSTTTSTMTPTTTTTEACKTLGEPCGECCAGLTCGALFKRCVPSIGRRKKRSGEGCDDLVWMEREAFAVCEVDEEVGLTWEEVEQCEAKFAYAGVPLPTELDFQGYDLNGDGVLLFEEWQEKTNCGDD
eukprot:GFUD01105084.1.p1 GENE.GFUD01105084.1~~GFUD01105084.1.p1  ORF type:complete len:151 (-),score=36.29 GFUD01105084.1:51-503(-)